jgi:hypothetical protein
MKLSDAMQLKRTRLLNELTFLLDDVSMGGSEHKEEIAELRAKLKELDEAALRSG